LHMRSPSADAVGKNRAAKLPSAISQIDNRRGEAGGNGADVRKTAAGQFFQWTRQPQKEWPVGVAATETIGVRE
jgi:hypothetical protein